MHLRLFGPIALTNDSGADALEDSSQPKRIALLAYLAIAGAGNARTFVRRDSVLALFWPESTEKDARRSLNQALHYLRHVAGTDVVVSRGADSIGIDPAKLHCDVLEFDRAITAGQHETAVALYRGPLMDGLSLSGMPEFDDWLSRERALRARQAAAAAWTLAERPSLTPATALQLGARALAILPDEADTRRLIALHDRHGDRAGAIQVYESLAVRLRDDYAVEPAPETQALVDAVRKRTTPSSDVELPPVAPIATPTRRGRITRRLAMTAVGIVGVAALLGYSFGGGRKWRAYLDYRAGDADYRAGRFGPAVVALQRAVQEDTTFALGYYRLATAANWNEDQKTQEWAEGLAVAHRNRLSKRDARKLDAWVAWQHGRVETAEAEFQALVREDPTDADAALDLADIHFHWGATLGIPLIATVDEWTRVLHTAPASASALIHAARVAAARRDSVAFDSLRARISRLNVDRDRAIELEVLRAFTFGDHASRLAAIRDAATIAHGARDVVQYAIAFSPTLADVDDDLFGILLNANAPLSRDDGVMLTRASVEMARGHLRAVAATLDSTSLINSQHTLEYRAVFATLPGAAASASDRARLADELRRSSPIARSSVMRLYLLGLLAVRDRDTISALRYATQLDSMHLTGGGSAYAERTARIIRAESFRTAGNSAAALSLLGPPAATPDRTLPHVWSYSVAHERFLRGQLLEDLGRPVEALRWYETFPDPRGYDTMYRPAALERRAAIEAALGRTSASEGHQAELLTLRR